MIPASANPLLLRSAATQYQVSRSLRFNSADSAYLSRTPASAGNRRTWTFSAWVKRSSLGVFQSIFNCIASDASYYTQFIFETSDKFVLYDNLCPGGVAFTTTQVFRDTSAWFHFLLYYDTTQSTASAKAKLYINGIEVTQFDADNRSSLTSDSSINRTAQHVISGRLPYTGGSSGYLSGYLAEVHFVDGQALTPSNFTETDATTGQLIPKLYSGSYGTNGFKLNFSDNSNNTAATLGKDTANSNNWTPNNFSVTAGAGNDSLVDTPVSSGTDTGAGGEVRGNYCALNPLNNGGITLSNGNLDWAGNGAGTKVSYGTVAVSSGKWYFEASINGATGGVNWECGIARVGTANNSRPGATANGWQVGTSSTTTIFKINNNSTANIYTSGLTNGDILSVAFDVDNGRIWFARNGTWLEGSPSAGTGASFTNVSGTVAPFGGSDGSGPSSAMNFGQRPFAYAAPSGFKALCDTNLPAPVIAKPSTVMDVLLWSGTGGNRSFSSLNMSPDFVWIKQRNQAFSTGHQLYDIVRGAGSEKELNSSGTGAEGAGNIDQYGWLSSFDSNGFSVTAGPIGADYVNASGTTYVAWTWDAGTSTVTNNVGSITSSVRANASAGFSIVTYTGNGSNATVGHGLGATPGLIIVKTRNTTRDWIIWTTGFTTAEYLLFTTVAKQTFSNQWGSLPTSSVFGVWDGTVNQSGNTFVAYCWAPVSGYSSFGSYTGNGSANGPFVFTGHRSRWLLIKNSSASENWRLHDTARSPYNVMQSLLFPNLSNAEATSSEYNVDILSNGFKIRANTAGSLNDNGSVYVWASFAENPFQYARAR